MNLALKYRPRQFDEVVGQRAIAVVLQAMIQKDMLDQVLLFTGPSGVGKTSMARIIASQLNSEAAQDVHEGTHPAVLEIDAASNGSVAALRQLKKDLNYAIAGHRVVILDEAHAISDEGKAVLLNLLEFPPKNVTFILITTEAHEIPQQVRHRCDTYEFKRASVLDISHNLQKVAQAEGIEVDSDLVNLIAQRSEGSYRESLMILKQVWAGGVRTVEEYNELHGDHDFGPNLLLSAIKGPAEAMIHLQNTLLHTATEDISDRIVETLRDLMIIRSGMELDYTGDALEVRHSLASKLDQGKILKSIRIMWDLQTKLGNGDPVRGLEMAFSLISEAITTKVSNELSMKSVQAHTEQIKQQSSPMSLQQMRNMRG